MDHEMDAKTMLGHRRVENLRFRDAFRGGGFLVHFRSAKSGSKSGKRRSSGRPRDTGRPMEESKPDPVVPPPPFGLYDRLELSARYARASFYSDPGIDAT